MLRHRCRTRLPIHQAADLGRRVASDTAVRRDQMATATTGGASGSVFPMQCDGSGLIRPKTALIGRHAGQTNLFVKCRARRLRIVVHSRICSFIDFVNAIVALRIEEARSPSAARSHGVNGTSCG